MVHSEAFQEAFDRLEKKLLLVNVKVLTNYVSLPSVTLVTNGIQQIGN